MKSKVILFGGTFDPVHRGHVTVAQFCLTHLDGDQLIFIPAKRSPHKELLPVASDEARIDMLGLAICHKSSFDVSDYELKMAQPSYTLNTIRYFRQKLGSSAQLFWIIGADTVPDLVKWYKIDELIDQCHLCVMYRAGFEAPDFGGLENSLGTDRVEKLRKNLITTPLLDISSTEIRHRLGAGVSTGDMLDSEVLAYIRKNRVYSA